MASKSQGRRAAKASAAGQRQLPKSTTSRARKAASFIGPIDPADRDAVIDIKMHGWWDNGKSLETPRFTYSANSAYNEAIILTDAGVPDNIINVVQVGPRDFLLYANRWSG
jgi:DNA-binding NarL/FixJ family response regulator